MIQNILVVCVGNICRSPMAEGLFRQQLIDKTEMKISSAGLHALVGNPPVMEAQEVMQEKTGIDISTHRARQLTPEILLQADLILVMETSQQKQIEFSLPSICGRVHRLGKWDGFDISDPYRHPKQVFERTLLLIDHCVNDWQTRLWK